jgi:hypothetical protein
MYLGYAFKCANCHDPINKTKPYVIHKIPTRRGVVNKHYHPECYIPKRVKPMTFKERMKKMEDGVVGVYLGLGDRKGEVKIGVG